MRLAFLSESEQLRIHLLGDPSSSIQGLITRVGDKVKSYATGYGPAFHTGSVMLTGVSRSAESETYEDLFELGLSILGVLRGQRVPFESALQVRQWLTKNQRTDVEYLIGCEQDEGLLDQLRDRVKQMFREEPLSLRSAVVLRDIKDTLQGFLGGCAHEFTEQPSEAKGVHVMRCHCGAAYTAYDGNDATWYPV